MAKIGFQSAFIISMNSRWNKKDHLKVYKPLDPLPLYIFFQSKQTEPDSNYLLLANEI